MAGGNRSTLMAPRRGGRGHFSALATLAFAVAALGLAAAAGCAAHVQKRRLLTPDEFLTGRLGAAALPPATAQQQEVGGQTKRRPPKDMPDFLKAHLKDGRVVIFSSWQVDPSSRRVTGQGTALDLNRAVSASGARSVPLDSVALFESNVIETSNGVYDLAGLTVLSAAVSIVCILNPKSCFGSCPTFYLWDGEKQSLQAEGFSASVSPSLEASDVDALYRARPQGQRLSITMRNEALETHVVRYVDLLAAPRGPGERVFATPAGDFVATSELRSPERCSAEEGDCRDALLAFDGRERFSLADSTDLAAREQIDLEFAPRAGGDWGLVLASRQTLLTTYLFYQALAYMGRSAGAWLAALERGDASTRERSRALGELLGGIEVLGQDATGEWVVLGSTRETGPLAADVRLLPLPEGVTKLRLRLARGAWRVDWVALARVERRVEPLRLPPARVLRDGAEDPEILARLRERSRPVTTLPGDAYELIYDLPGDPAGCELFVESRGYYLEWMREQWLAEENPAMAAIMFTEPRLALRLMAPDFKRLEPRMETLFWESRYVKR